MSPESILLSIILFAIGLLALYFRTLVKSTVEESVKNQFEIQRQKMREDFEREMNAFERKDKFRLAALDKRLEAHQLAFALALEMYVYLHASFDERKEVNHRLAEFWRNHSLYLTNKARKAFKTAYDYYSTYNTLVQAWKMNPNEEREKRVNERFDFITRLPEMIASEVDLEAMEDEAISLMNKKITPFGIKRK